MTNTPENKRKFMYLYEGQNVLRYQDNPTNYIMNWELDKFNNEPNNKCKINTAYLTLKPLSAISDEDKIEITRLVFGESYVPPLHKDDKDFCIAYGTAVITKDFNFQYPTSLQIFDYLRSKSYLLPFMDLSIEQILAYGWAVIN